MSHQDNTYIIPEGLYFKGVLQDIKKSQRALQPIFEAFTNCIEAIKTRAEEVPNDYHGEISIRINAAKTTDDNVTEFRSLSITDNGIGFNDKEGVQTALYTRRLSVIGNCWNAPKNEMRFT